MPTRAEAAKGRTRQPAEVERRAAGAAATRAERLRRSRPPGTSIDAEVERLFSTVATRAEVDLAVAQRVIEAILHVELALDAVRSRVERSLLPPLEELALVPQATIEAARRSAELRLELLDGGAYTLEHLAELRGVSYAATRQWIRRNDAQDRVVTVTYDNRTLVPAICLNDDLDLRPELHAPIAALRAVGEDSWGLWAWLATPSAWLGGAVPAELAAEAPDRVAEAARRRASNAA